MKALPCPMVQYTPFPRRNLPLCISPLTKPCYRVNPSIPFTPWSTSPLYSEERRLSSTLCRSPRAQPNFQERPISTSAHFQPPRCTTKGTSLHQDQSLACVPPCMDFIWRQMEDCIPNLLWFI